MALVIPELVAELVGILVKQIEDAIGQKDWGTASNLVAKLATVAPSAQAIAARDKALEQLGRARAEAELG